MNSANNQAIAQTAFPEIAQLRPSRAKLIAYAAYNCAVIALPIYANSSLFTFFKGPQIFLQTCSSFELIKTIFFTGSCLIALIAIVLHVRRIISFMNSNEYAALKNNGIWVNKSNLCFQYTKLKNYFRSTEQLIEWQSIKSIRSFSAFPLQFPGSIIEISYTVPEVSGQSALRTETIWISNLFEIPHKELTKLIEAHINSRNN